MPLTVLSFKKWTDAGLCEDFRSELSVGNKCSISNAYSLTRKERCKPVGRFPTHISKEIC